MNILHGHSCILHRAMKNTVDKSGGEIRFWLSVGWLSDGQWSGWSELISVDLRTFLLHVGHMVVVVGLTWVNFSWLEFGWEKNFWFRVGRLVRVVGPPPPPDLPPLPGYKWTVDKQGGRFIHRPPVNPKSEEFLHQMKKKAQVPKVQLLRRDDSEPWASNAQRT